VQRPAPAAAPVKPAARCVERRLGCVPPLTGVRRREGSRSAARRAEPSGAPVFQGDGSEVDARVRQALRQSVRVGDALLKQEAAELERIAALARELLDKESRTPSPPFSCGAERDACSACYVQNAAQPLACRAQVDAFARCVTGALEATL
jgi:hypothetical protein